MKTCATKIDGAWVAVPPYQQVTLGEVSASWETFTTWDDATRESFGAYAVPEPSDPPAGKVETARKLGGTTRPKWVVTYGAAPVPSLDERRAFKVAAINTRRDALLAAGFTPSQGRLAGKTLQTRDADDKINWKLSRDAYKEAVEAGFGAAPQATFRTAANETVTLTIAEGLTVLTAMQAWGVAVLGRSWALKDAIAGAADTAALDAIDVDEGWPT